MANSFSKEERVAFEQILEGFEDNLVLSRNVTVYNTDSVEMERTNNVIWRPQPYIGLTFDGTDQTANFTNYTQLSVPSTLGYQKSAPWIMTALELRDALQANRLGESAKQKLASDINVAVMNVASLYGSLFVKRSAAAVGYDDVSQCDAIMNEQGIPSGMRYLALSSRDYNGMANNLQGLSRSFGNDISDSALRRSRVGMVSSFDTYKLDYAVRQTAAAGGGGLTMSTLVGAANYYVPRATSTATTGETSNVDNRFQTITISSTTSVAAGDAFTVATLNAVNHITKTDTGQLKTFRVVSVASSTTLVITPPMITAQGASAAELQYKNCVINTPASNSAIVFLNTVTAATNPFWHKDAIELMPGRYAVPTDAGTAVMRGSTDQGIELVMQKWYDIKTMKTFYRVDEFFGVTATNTEMMGVMMFSQT